MTHDEYVAYHKAYREAHREELARKQRAYYRRNKEARLAYAKKWAKENPDKVKARMAKHQKTQKHKDYQREYRKSNAQKLYQQRQAREIERYGHAHKMIENRLRRGKLEKQPCEVCGSEPAEAHHDDYNKPLEIRWLCKKCHTKWHNENEPKLYESVKGGAKMKCRVTAYPYAVQRGTIEVPDNVPEDEIDAYIEEYWNQIDFDAPELDYAGTDFDWHIVEESIERF